MSLWMGISIRFLLEIWFLGEVALFLGSDLSISGLTTSETMIRIENISLYSLIARGSILLEL